MEWYISLLLLFAGLLFLMFTGIPVAFSFLLAGIVGMPILMGGINGGGFMIVSTISEGLVNFQFLPIPLFVLMGEIIFQAKVAPQLIDSLDKWIGKVPGRLSLMAVASGVLFSTLTGTSIASTAMLGNSLLPEMNRKGYSKSMSIGPILGSGGLAIMIPPSSLAVLIGAIAEVSIGKILIAIILPGILMALIFSAYIVAICILKPESAPPSDAPVVSLSEKIHSFLKYILPIGVIIFAVVGVIFIGVASPSEASATGALACFVYVAYLRRLTFTVVKDALLGTVRVSVMIFTIVATAELFSQMLAYSGSAEGLTGFVLGIDANKYLILIGMMIVVFILGMFLNSQAIIMITVPIFMPVVVSLGFDPVWYCVVFLLNLEMGTMSPPFGLALFVMKGVAPKDTKMSEIVGAALPFLALDVLIMAILIIFPQTALWLVNSMS